MKTKVSLQAAERELPSGPRSVAERAREIRSLAFKLRTHAEKVLADLDGVVVDSESSKKHEEPLNLYDILDLAWTNLNRVGLALASIENHTANPHANGEAHMGSARSRRRSEARALT